MYIDIVMHSREELYDIFGMYKDGASSVGEIYYAIVVDLEDWGTLMMRSIKGCRRRSYVYLTTHHSRTNLTQSPNSRHTKAAIYSRARISNDPNLSSFTSSLIDLFCVNR